MSEFYKNTASQRVFIAAVDAVTGAAKTSGVSFYVTKDNGAQAASGGTATHRGNGQWEYIFMQAETNADTIGLAWAGTDVIPGNVTIYTTTARTSDVYSRQGAPAGASMSADIAQVKAKTDLLPASPAAQGKLDTVESLASGVNGFAAIKAQVAAIEADTQDLQTQIGVDGAGLTAIGDARLANLDAAVSSRATESEVLDAVADLPTTSELEARTLDSGDYATASGQEEILGAIEGVGGVTITPVMSTVSAGQVVSDDLTVYQGETKPFTFVLVDSEGTAVNESGDTLVLVVENLDGTTAFEETGTVGGGSNNQITVTIDDANTGTAGTFRYTLWNTTEDLVRARGAFEIVATGEPE